VALGNIPGESYGSALSYKMSVMAWGASSNHRHMELIDS